ncbi:hypothetical protein N9C66_08095 [Akkermansiaceae bacterium]|nr:hypothetical protein [Akkermansiaceae bacterium]
MPKLVYLLFLTLGILSAKTKFSELVTTDGTTYKSVSVREVTPAGIRVFHSAGAATIPYEVLPKEAQEELGGFDADKAAKYREEQAKKQKAINNAHTRYNMRSAKLQKAKNEASLLKEKIKNAKKYWVIGKVMRVETGGALIKPASDDNRDIYRTLRGIGETDEAKRRLEKEKNKLPAKLKSYLSKNGTFFGSDMGKKYVAQNWIKSPEDYQRYFSLRTLFNQFQMLDSLAKYPILTPQAAPVYIKTETALQVADGDYISLWVMPEGYHRTPSGRSYKAFSLFESE